MPSTTETKPKNRAPRRVDQQPKPEAATTSAAPPAEQSAMFDPPPQEADQTQPTSEPSAPPSAPAPTEATGGDALGADTPPVGSGAEDAPPSDTDDAQGDAGEAAHAEAPPPAPVAVRLGQVEGLLHRVPMEAVQMILAGCGERIATLQGSRGVRALEAGVRATEGRCAPIFLCQAGPDDMATLVAGLETMAAAQTVGLDHVAVVIVAKTDVGAVQSYLAQRANSPVPTPEDDLVRQVLSYDQ